MTRREIIIELARTLRDVQPGLNSSTPGDLVHGTAAERSYHQQSWLYHAGSYHHLETALDTMRNHPDPVRQWRWHFTQRYISQSVKAVQARTRGHKVEIMVDGQWQPAKPTRGHREPLGGIYSDTHGHRLIRIETWHNHVQPNLVEKALNWLDTNMPARLHLPDWQQAA